MFGKSCDSVTVLTFNCLSFWGRTKSIYGHPEGKAKSDGPWGFGPKNKKRNFMSVSCHANVKSPSPCLRLPITTFFTSLVIEGGPLEITKTFAPSLLPASSRHISISTDLLLGVRGHSGHVSARTEGILGGGCEEADR